MLQLGLDSAFLIDVVAQVTSEDDTGICVVRKISYCMVFKATAFHIEVEMLDWGTGEGKNF